MTRADAFGQRGVTAIRPLPGGHRNEVWLVERDGVRLVAKSTGHSEAGLRWLLPVLAAAREAGLGAVPLLAEADGRFGSGGLTLEPFVEGCPGSRSDIVRLAPRLAAFHARLRRYPDRPGLPRPAAPCAHRSRLRRAMARLDPDRTVIHGDVTPANLLIAEAGPVLVDWDEARRDHPGFDLPQRVPKAALNEARVAHEIVYGWAIEPGHARTLAQRW